MYKNIPIGKSNVYKPLVDYMVKNNSRYVALNSPQTRPEFFKKDLSIPFHKKFPDRYVHEFESLLAQSDPKGSILCVSPFKNKCEIIKIKSSKENYDSGLLSFFIQSIQQINPTSNLLYEMLEVHPKHRSGTFVTSDTNHCCFKKLIVKMARRPTTDYSSNNIELILMVQDHVNHSGLLNMSALNKWLCWEDEHDNTDTNA